MEIVIATHNVHKIREFREMFKVLPQLEVLSLLHFPQYVSPEETGLTFEENALIKARDAAAHLKMWVLADDSGLVVPALEGAPGVISRRYAGEDASDFENRKKLLQEMRGLSEEDRGAYFECCLALSGPDHYEKVFSATCEGHILREERGRYGFGYDSLFVKSDYDKTFAEIDEGIKNRISHRRKAFDKVIVALEAM